MGEKKLLDQYSLFQKIDGSFSLHENDSVIHIHSLCYALEGLIFGYHITKEKNYLKICEDAFKMVFFKNWKWWKYEFVV